ncbi:MAG: alpha-L-glutamate ligase-like protein [Alphaproteobacteria bacterium]|nr:alpha-L-glutamate ligase-like protein [Alphaproteobacteria bacterium]
MISTWRKLREKGVIGINERNVMFVSAKNPRRFMRRVDDKVETKRLADIAGIPNPELYGVIETARDMKALPALLAKPDGCVIKPACGSQGKGIIVIDGPLREGWRLSSGKRITRDAINHHVNNIRSGMYSLGGQTDKAVIEYRVKFDPVFGRISFKGVPDIRVIVLNGVPAFAMLRLPTAESDGKANLHRGGVGVGVSIVDGTTRCGMQFDRQVVVHPDTGETLTGITVPHWDDILVMAARSYDVTGLGYIGVDVVLDEKRGPLLLELNGRPGLSIQIANQRGLRRHLAAISALDVAGASPESRVRLAQKVYGESYEGGALAPAPVSGKPVLDVLEGGLASAAA